MRADSLISELSKIHPKGFDLSLVRITELLEKLGRPQAKIPPCIHVAGTNGKGSTIAFCRAILEAQGYKVHVHTSPHLVNWHERYRLAGELVSDEVLAKAIDRVATANNDEPITVFEILSAVMFVLFSEHPADFCLVEVGLGGRFDATNVIEEPLVSAIAPIAMDHQAYLGDTLEAIAFEKGGIIKDGHPVAIGSQSDSAIEVLEGLATERNSQIKIAGQDYDFYQQGVSFVYQDEDGLLDLPLPALAGEHQLSNAALAIASLRLAGIPISADAYENAMRSVYWPGRFERLPKGKITSRLNGHADIWLDGGHNPSAGEALAKSLARLNLQAKRKTLLVCGMINTKDPSGFFRAFNGLDTEVFTVPVTMSDAGIPASELSSMALQASLNAKSFETLADAIEEVSKRLAGENDCRVLFCGSLYLAGEVLELNETPPK